LTFHSTLKAYAKVPLIALKGNVGEKLVFLEQLPTAVHYCFDSTDLLLFERSSAIRFSCAHITNGSYAQELIIFLDLMGINYNMKMVLVGLGYVYKFTKVKHL
jgi:hypothetical protein